MDYQTRASGVGGLDSLAILVTLPISPWLSCCAIMSFIPRVLLWSRRMLMALEDPSKMLMAGKPAFRGLPRLSLFLFPLVVQVRDTGVAKVCIIWVAEGTSLGCHRRPK